ncbi:hypothetical protein RHOSPDRAFT_36620 [Rhodotorula sp. JG-1b]|nr:hypothetical protein RHOSPDRAFT_36620 [Rhodotorula sp. JG-1b]
MDNSQAGPSRPARPQQALGEPFDSGYAIDKRAIALVEKAAPRGEPDLLLDYLDRNPACNGVFAAWELANKSNNSPLSAAALSCLTSLVRLASTDPFTSSNSELLKALFSTQYAPYFERSLNPGRNDVTTAVLKLANVLVGFAGGKYARKVFNSFTWSPKVTSRLYKTRLRSLTSFNALTKPDIRTLLVLLVLSFLTAGDLRLKTSVVETKGLVAGVFKGMNEDAKVVVNLVLETVGRELVLDRRVGLEARRNVFDEACINELVKLYDYPLPVEDDADLPASHPSLSVHRFFRLISHWLADQIATSPIGRSSGPQRVLSILLRALKVTEDSVQRELGLEILAGAPVLAGAFWAKFPSSLDPRLSSRWVSAITFATRVVGLPVPATLSLPPHQPAHATTASTAPPSVTSILDTILPPATTSSLNRAWYTKALTHETPLVSFLSSLFLLSILQKAAAVLATMAETSRLLEEETAQGRWASQVRKVREELRARLPDPAIVVGLMTKTAAAAAGDAPASASGGGKKGSKESGRSEDVEMSAATAVPAAGSEGALLRTNVALRILFLYHRVVPQLISTLKFDFAKLPQTYARRPPTTTTSGGGEEGEEGIRAISSAYALRLAAAHSTASSIVSFNRPGDHFKQSLVPLFQLYRIPSTPSNRSLLREILKRQLDTPLLLGSSSSSSTTTTTTANDDDDEIEVWLRALPVPTVEADEVEVVLSFFEHAVQKTLTSPLKPVAAAVTDSDHQAPPAPLLSPLMQNVLAALPAALTTDEDEKAQQVLAFFKDVVLHMCAQQQTLAAAQSAMQQFKSLVVVDKAITVAEPTVQLLEDCLAVLTTSTPAVEAPHGLAATLSTLLADADARATADFVSTLSPTRENVFAALITPSTSETALDALRAVLAAMPVPLVLLHARESDFDTAATRQTLVQLVQNADFCVPAVQVALHRLRAGFSDGVAAFVREVDASVRESSGAKAAIAERVASKDGLLGVFTERGQSFETLKGTLALLSAVLDPQDQHHRQLAQPFCELVLADLPSATQPPTAAWGEKKRKRRASEAATATGSALPARVLAAGPLLPFFDPASSLPLLEALIGVLSQSGLDENARTLLSAALDSVAALEATDAFLAFWSSQLLKLNSLAQDAHLKAAAVVMIKGADAIMPVTGRKADVEPDLWDSQAAKWTKTLLSGGPFGPAQSATVAALVYRSAAARAAFSEWLQQQADSSDDANVVALARPILALVQVTEVRRETLPVPQSIVLRQVEQILDAGASVSDEASAAVQALLRHTASAIAPAKDLVLKRIASVASVAESAEVISAVLAICAGSPDLAPVLERAVNSSFEPLTRAFVDAVDSSENDEALQTLAGQLVQAVETNETFSLDGNKLDVLLTAIATARGDQAYATNLGAALCRRQQIKDNEVTRHLNEIYASTAFITLAANPVTADAMTVTAVLDFVFALASTSIASAANARSVERLVPFYRGTLSNSDRSLLDLFQRVEMMSPASISPLLRAWIPTSEPDASLDGTRIGALAVADKKAIRRSWARAFASSRIRYSATENAKTFDPVFLVGFLTALVDEDDMKPQDWTLLLESGVLGTAVAALASSSYALRGLARATLAALAERIKPLTFREKEELELVLTQVRLSIYSPAGEPLPASIALFLAHCISLVGAPESPLYPTFMRFLLQRSTIDARDVPMFYSMLYSSNADEFAASPRDERAWMVRFLMEGLVRTQDWKIYRRRQVFELLASLFSSTRADPSMRRAVLKFLVRATSIPTAARELLSRNGLLGWFVAQTWNDSSERQLALEIVLNVLEVLPWEKLPGVADAVEAIEIAAAGDASQVDATVLLALVREIATHLAPPSPAPGPTTAESTPAPAPLLRTILARLTALMTLLSSRIVVASTSRALKEQFYATAMLLSFVRHEANIGEEEMADKALWSVAVRAGLDAGVEELQQEVIRLRSG